MKKLKDILAQKRKAIQEKEDSKKAKLDMAVEQDEQSRKAREAYVLPCENRWDPTVVAEFHCVAQDSKTPCTDDQPALDSAKAPLSDADPSSLSKQHSDLADAEVRRRLRRLGHPVTLFGETAVDRHARYRHVERTFEVMDEGAIGGESANVLLTIQKEDRLKAKQAAMQSNHETETTKATPPTQEGNGTAEEEVCSCWCVRTCEAVVPFRECIFRCGYHTSRSTVSRVSAGIPRGEAHAAIQRGGRAGKEAKRTRDYDTRTKNSCSPESIHARVEERS